MKRVIIGSSTMNALGKELKDYQKGVHIAFYVVVALLLCLLLFSNKIASSTQDMSPTVMLEVGAGSGSAVFIGNNQLLTAAHVVDGMDLDDHCRVSFENPNSTDGRQVYADATLIAVGDYKLDTCLDFALLQITSLEASNISKPYNVGHSKKVKVQDPIHVEGYPGGFYSNTDGTINSINGKSNPDLFVVNASSWPGNSGGALLDGNNNVIGLVVIKGYGRTNDGQTYAIKIDRIRKELQAKGFTI